MWYDLCKSRNGGVKKNYSPAIAVCNHLFNSIQDYLFTIAELFTILFNYTAQAGLNSNIALGLFNIKDSLRGGQCFMETEFAAAARGS